MTVNVATAGTLCTLISLQSLPQITTLKIVGPINGTDIALLRHLYGADMAMNATDGRLAELDLDEATIVPGGGCYADGLRSEEDTVSRSMFAHTRLRSIVLPAATRIIGQRAFEGCAMLGSVVMPPTVTAIGRHAFAGCRSLAGIALSKALTDIGTCAFIGCTALTDITLPQGIRTIRSNTFGECAALSRLTLNEEIRTIESWAFEKCASLTQIRLPARLAVIGALAFCNCTGLACIRIDGPRPPLCHVPDAFYGVDRSRCVLTASEQCLAACRKADIWRSFAATCTLAP